jgi:hypothetical protein
MARLLSKLLQKADACFDRLSTNGKSTKISTSEPFALSVSKGERRVFQCPARNLPFATSRPKWCTSAAVFTSLLITPALALAHGGMGPDEIAPPIVTSGLLGLAGYWVVMLWPSAKKKGAREVGASGQNLHAPRTDRPPPKRSTRVKRKPRLRKIEGNGQFGSDQNPRRRASDG